MRNEKLALVLGATGGAGGEIAFALKRRGWRVRAMGRDAEAAARKLPAFEWVTGDAMKREDVTAASQGARVIVHGVNPPGYRNWAQLVVPMIENTIAAARASGARIVLPGTVYNFGPETFPLIAEDAPQRPRTRKGKIRVELEKKLEAAAHEGVKSLIVRAGDFFGPRTTQNSWFVQIAKPGKAVTSLMYPGVRTVGHAWAYLPDLGETVARVLERENELAAFERFHFGGHYFARGVVFAERISDVIEKRVPIHDLPWWAVRLVAPFMTPLRETLEMRYLWRRAVQLDNRKLVAFLGSEPHTPIDVALRRALEGQGCLAAERPAQHLQAA